MDVGSTQHAHAAAAAVASNPGQQQRMPTHLIVMVNGLWGFQRDWNKMQQALQAADRQGNCLIHVSGVNTGARTYDGEQQHCSTAQLAVFLAAHTNITAIDHTLLVVGCWMGEFSSPVCMRACSAHAADAGCDLWCALCTPNCQTIGKRIGAQHNLL
jgi:hypothetical protein